MTKKNSVIIHIILLLIIVLSIKSVYAKEYTINQSDYYVEYNTILVDMDKAFSNLKDTYGYSNDDMLINKLSELFFYKKHAGGNCSGKKNNYAYRVSSSQKVNVSKKNQQIYVPDIYNICEDISSLNIKNKSITVDDSVNVTIEIKNNKYYVPLYFFSAIPGVTVKVDGKTVYKSENGTYYDVKSALNSSSSHTIKLIVNKVEQSEYSKLAKDIGQYEYYGEEKGALWREEALKRIEKNRKSNVTITVKDKNGKVIDNATVTVKQTNNDFKFGTAIAINNGTNVFVNNINSTYFNAVGSENIFKGNYYYSKDEKTVQSERNSLISTAKSKGITYVRGHTLFWDRWNQWGGSAINKSFKVIGTIDDCRDEIKACKASSSCKNYENIKSDIITMGCVRNIYTDANSDGNYTSEEKTLINNWITTLKTRFKNGIYNYITNTVSNNKTVDEWDLFNELAGTLYFRYYLFGEKFLTYKITNDNDNFLKVANRTKEFYNDEVFNEFGTTWESFNATFNKGGYSEYIDFLVECVNVYRKNTNKLLVINESKVNGMYSRGIDTISNSTRYDSNKSAYHAEWLIRIINNRLKAKGMKTIDAIGFESHVHMRYFLTPYSYYNAYTKFLNNVGVSHGRVTEFDTLHGNNTNLSSNERTLRANYLRDFMIATYSNYKMDLFFTWVYTSNFTDEEKVAYRDTVYEWLNQTESLNTVNGMANSRLTKGAYTITVKYDGKEEVRKNVSVSGSSKSIEIKMSNVSISTTSSPKSGDVDGDGKVTISDYLRIRKHILKMPRLTGNELTRADVDKNGEVGASDYIKIRKIILGLS